jgi:hypothetical protein
MRHSSPSLTLVAVALFAAAGCASKPYNKSAIAEPPLILGEQGSTVDAPPPVRSASVVDRHPLFSKPAQVYQNTNQNGVVKAAAATFVGIPWGIAGELKQIAVGRDPTAP